MDEGSNSENIKSPLPAREFVGGLKPVVPLTGQKEGTTNTTRSSLVSRPAESKKRVVIF